MLRTMKDMKLWTAIIARVLKTWHIKAHKIRIVSCFWYPTYFCSQWIHPLSSNYKHQFSPQGFEGEFRLREMMFQFPTIQLVSCNFFLFPNMKFQLKGYHLGNIQTESQEVLSTVTLENFQLIHEILKKLLILLWVCPR